MNKKSLIKKELKIFSSRINEINTMRNKIQIELEKKEIEVRNAVNVDLYDVYEYMGFLNNNYCEIVNNLDELIKINNALMEKMIYISIIYEEIKSGSYKKRLDNATYVKALNKKTNKTAK